MSTAEAIRLKRRNSPARIWISPAYWPPEEICPALSSNFERQPRGPIPKWPNWPLRRFNGLGNEELASRKSLILPADRGVRV